MIKPILGAVILVGTVSLAAVAETEDWVQRERSNRDQWRQTTASGNLRVTFAAPAVVESANGLCFDCGYYRSNNLGVSRNEDGNVHMRTCLRIRNHSLSSTGTGRRYWQYKTTQYPVEVSGTLHAVQLEDLPESEFTSRTVVERTSNDRGRSSRIRTQYPRVASGLLMLDFPLINDQGEKFDIDTMTIHKRSTTSPAATEWPSEKSYSSYNTLTYSMSPDEVISCINGATKTADGQSVEIQIER